MWGPHLTFPALSPCWRPSCTNTTTPPGPTTVAWRTQVLDNIPHIRLDTTAAGPIALTPTQAAALVLHLTHGQGRWALPHGDSATRWLDLSPLSAHQRMAQAQHLLSRPIP